MPTVMTMRELSEASIVMLRAILAVVFLLAALPKLRRPKQFVIESINYRVLPPGPARLYGWLVPYLELVVALCALTGVMVNLAAGAMALLMASFVIAIGLNMLRGRDLDCHCFGDRMHRRIGWPTLLQDGALLLASLLLMALTWPRRVPEYWSVYQLVGLHIPAPAITAAAGCGCIVLTLLLARLLHGMPKGQIR